MQRFKNAEEVLAYYASLNGDFKVVEEAFNSLKKENEEQKELIDNLGNQLATEKLSRIQNEADLESLGKELATFKLSNMKGAM